MCGRYVSPEQAAIEREWHIGRHSNPNPFRDLFNVAPTMRIPILRADAETGELELTEARWGLVPLWWKEAKPPRLSFNARSEEAAKKPMWRHPYRHSRCLIPAVGWYEWQAVERVDPNTGEVRTIKQPHFIFSPDRKLCAFAGLMSHWKPEGKAEIVTAALMTRSAAPSVADVHDRMPVVLPESAFAAWLAPSTDKAEDVSELIGHARTEFQHYPVSMRLNTTRDDDAGLIAPIEPPAPNRA